MRRLGYERVYDIHNIIYLPGHIDLWKEAFRRKFSRHDEPLDRSFWEFLETYDVLCGMPCTVFAQELIKAFPDAKVILTVRENVEEWQDSYNDTLWPKFEKYHRSIFPYGFYRTVALFPCILWPAEVKNGVQRWIARYSIGKLLVAHSDIACKDPDRRRAHYEAENQSIKDLLLEDGPEKFLEFKVADGWDRLCRFLGVDQPYELEPFPHRIWMTGNYCMARRG
ncbi:Nad dependent epimerase dehydratase [Neofusicoccum parvum]|uniref:Nad dependent epimerase dehydratase n=1 Tax=Neofusicoccum parvum TaxID=310453 RepID=A0ACB5RZ69_9PEZI|nr:Nad dependent epimerase dehydratase [Neofusicoccum parvum]